MTETADDEISQLLQSWGLSDLKAKFRANYIVLQALEYLNEQDIIDLIPKIGQRAIFRGRLQQWRKEIASKEAAKAINTSKTTAPDPAPVIEIKNEPVDSDEIPKQPAQATLKPISPPKPTPAIVMPQFMQHKIPKIITLKPCQPHTKSPTATAKPVIRLVSPQSLFPQVTVQKVGKVVSPASEQIKHKIYGTLTKCSPMPKKAAVNTAKSVAIQSKVQQFYIRDSNSSPPKAPAPTLGEFQTSTPKPVAAPFVTSIIRVETKSEAESSMKNSKVNRTTILQKLNTSENASTTASIVSQHQKTTKSPEPVQQAEATTADDSLLYPMIKLETELLDTSSWKEHQDQNPPKTKAPSKQKQLLDMEQKETDVDSSDFQMTYDSESLQESDSETSGNPHNTRKRGRRWSQQSTIKLDIRNILMGSEEGQSILDYYLANEFLDTDKRAALVRIIVDYCWQTNQAIKPRDCQEITSDILEIFPNEKTEDYFSGILGKNTKSPLYNRYRTLFKKHQRENGLTVATRKKKRKITPNIKKDFVRL